MGILFAKKKNHPKAPWTIGGVIVAEHHGKGHGKGEESVMAKAEFLRIPSDYGFSRRWTHVATVNEELNASARGPLEDGAPSGTALPGHRARTASGPLLWDLFPEMGQVG